MVELIYTVTTSLSIRVVVTVGLGSGFALGLAGAVALSEVIRGTVKRTFTNEQILANSSD